MPQFRIVFFTFGMLVLTVAMSWAQSTFQTGINFTLGFPQAEFKENIDNIGVGLSGHFCYHFPQTPILIGASLGFLIYGSETRREPLSATIPDVVVDVETTNNILMGHLIVRVQPHTQTGIVKPYFEGRLGFNYLWTETSVKDWDWDEDAISSTNYDDGALSYGGGGGLMICVYQNKTENPDKLDAVHLDFGVHYLFGGEAKYLKKGDIHRDNSKVTYHPSQSTTDLVTAQIGVIFNF